MTDIAETAANRSDFLASIPRRTKTVTVMVGGKRMVVELHQLTIEEMDNLTERIRKYGESKKLKRVPNGVTAAMTVQETAFVPCTEQRVFEAADLEAMLKTGAGGWLDTLFKAATDLLTTEAVDEGKDSESGQTG